MTETATKTVALKNGDEITVAPLTRGARKEALRNLEKRGIRPNVADLNILNGLEMQSETCLVVWKGWRRLVNGELTDTTPSDRKEAADTIDGLADVVTSEAGKFATEVASGYEVEEKNS